MDAKDKEIQRLAITVTMLLAAIDKEAFGFSVDGYKTLTKNDPTIRSFHIGEFANPQLGRIVVVWVGDKTKEEMEEFIANNLEPVDMEVQQHIGYSNPSLN